MDGFASDNFPDALKRDCLIGPLPDDDLNLSESDRQLAHDSDTEGGTVLNEKKKRLRALNKT